jgi:hypothetical protein
MVKRSGQAILFLLMALTVLVFILLLNIDLHRIIQRKDQAQNAGDAAALAAARWQGTTLNLIGELNLMHALALATPVPDEAAISAITNMQARLSFTGPLTGLYAAQLAAKNNHIYVDEGMTQLLKEHAETIRTQYASNVDPDTEYFAEPWLGAWVEYANMLDAIVADGIAAGPDNMQLFTDPEGGHILYTKEFYEAVTGKSWCWFYLFHRGLLESYSSYHDWPPIPEPDANQYTDCEIFGLGVMPFASTLEMLYTPEAIATLVNNANLGPVAAEQFRTNHMDRAETWYFYRPDRWSAWTRIKAEGEDAFPVAGNVREEYDYAGADVVVRVEASVDRITPGPRREDKVVWTAASKPFGYLESDGEKVRPNGFILPAFRAVRLIPMDAASGSENSSSDVEWVYHVKNHLKGYLEIGPHASSCKYCQALSTWEQASFRNEGVNWLSTNSASCKMPSPGGRRGGGTRRGH